MFENFLLIGESVLILGGVACVVVGVSSGVAVWWLLTALASEDLSQENEWRFDVSRINELRRVDPLYRGAQPIFNFLARLNRNAFRDKLPEIHRQVLVAGLSRCWLPEEYLAKIQLLSLLSFPLLAVGFWSWLGVGGVFLGFLMAFVVGWYLRQSLARRAAKRLREIKRRMPFLLDLLTLLMEAGASFIQSLRQSVREFDGHPIATEFSRVLSDMNMGKARTEAFDGLRKRLQDDEISAIVGAILQSEELGTPVSEIFRTQADVLRVKRSQRAERIAGEAGVNMLLPAMLVMASTVLLILGPFMLNYVIYGMGL